MKILKYIFILLVIFFGYSLTRDTIYEIRQLTTSYSSMLLYFVGLFSSIGLFLIIIRLYLNSQPITRNFLLASFILFAVILSYNNYTIRNNIYDSGPLISPPLIAILPLIFTFLAFFNYYKDISEEKMSGWLFLSIGSFFVGTSQVFLYLSDTMPPVILIFSIFSAIVGLLLLLSFIVFKHQIYSNVRTIANVSFIVYSIIGIVFLTVDFILAIKLVRNILFLLTLIPLISLLITVFHCFNKLSEKTDNGFLTFLILFWSNIVFFLVFIVFYMSAIPFLLLPLVLIAVIVVLINAFVLSQKTILI